MVSSCNVNDFINKHTRIPHIICGKYIELSSVKSQAICGRVFSTIKYIKLEVFLISNRIELKLPQIVLGYHKECMLF